MNHVDPRAHALRDALSGQVLRGTAGTQYHLRDRVGEGGQGWVFRATWEEPTGFVVIVKVLRPDVASPEVLARFQREAQVLRMLSQQARPNPHIVRFFDHATAYVKPHPQADMIALPFTVLEYVNGPTLEQVLQASRDQGLPVERARRIARHVVLGLEAVHAHRIVHRDLKPSNILLSRDGAGDTATEVAKVTDFGLVKLVELNLQRTTALAGASLGYAPPEQYEQGNERVSPRTDVFSFAAIVHEMLSGRPAFPFGLGENPLLILTRILKAPRPALARTLDTLSPELRARPELVERLDAQLSRALAPEPAERHESVTELWGALDPIFRMILPEARSIPPVAAVGMPPGGREDSAVHRPLRAPSDSRSERPRPGSGEVASSRGAAWRWALVTPSIGPGAVRGAVFTEAGHAFAVGAAGLHRWSPADAVEPSGARASRAGGGWTTTAVPGLDPSLLRGVLLCSQGELVLFGERGTAGCLAPWQPYRPWPLGVADVTFLGAFRDDGGIVTLVGERPPRSATNRPPQSAGGPPASSSTPAPSTVGVLAQVDGEKLTLMTETPGCPRLRAAARLRTGALVACGEFGALVRLELGVATHVGSICGGHLVAIAALEGGGALLVGAGGHALSLTARLEPTLERVQTTRDLSCVALAEDGTAWAGAAQARVLRRDGGTWVRMNGDVGTSAGIVALWAGPRTVRAVLDDGGVLEGTLA